MEKINELTEERLIEEVIGKIESKTLEFKQELPGNNDADKKEFLYDVSSFANSSGGRIIYGVEAPNGEGTKLAGIDLHDSNPDVTILRLEQIIRNGIEPRIPVCNIKFLKLSNGNHVLWIDIEPSWYGPHMVKYQDASKFCARHTNGKYLMNVQQIRQAFSGTEGFVERIRQFRIERVAKIYADETPVVLDKGLRIILHIVPLSAFSQPHLLTVNDIQKHSRQITLLSFEHRYPNEGETKINFDGVLSYTSNAYTLVYKNGIIEAVHSRDLQERIPSEGFESLLFHGVKSFIPLLNELNVTPPFFILLDLIGVKNFKIGMRNRPAVPNSYLENYKIDRDHLLIPEIIVEESIIFNPEKELRPILDAIWNAAGWPEDLNYDSNGNWIGRES